MDGAHSESCPKADVQIPRIREYLASKTGSWLPLPFWSFNDFALSLSAFSFSLALGLVAIQDSLVPNLIELIGIRFVVDIT
jgi:hypothetical protein